MSNSRIPSPARSQGAPVTPRRYKPRGTRSVGSPASTTSGRLSAMIKFKENNKDSFALSPAPSRRSVLNDDTYIDEPRRRSWWKKLGDNSRDVMEVLNDNQILASNEAVEEYIDIEVLSQEKKNYTLDLPDSSDSESISSIVIPQRKLFTQKDLHAQNKFGMLIGNRESLAKLHKSNVADKSVHVAPKNLFNQNNRPRTKPIFPAALLNVSPNKTVNKTKETVTEVKGQVRNLFGNRLGNKRKNMFADFVVSESEDEIPDIQPKVFGFQNKADQGNDNRNSRGRREQSPTSSVTTDIEMDEWQHLPSSTMVENQLEDMMAIGTPIKRAKLSKLAEIKETETRVEVDNEKESEEEQELKYDDDQSDNNSEKRQEVQNVNPNINVKAGNSQTKQNVENITEEQPNKGNKSNVQDLNNKQNRSMNQSKVNNKQNRSINLSKVLNTSKNKTNNVSHHETSKAVEIDEVDNQNKSHQKPQNRSKRKTYNISQSDNNDQTKNKTITENQGKDVEIANASKNQIVNQDLKESSEHADTAMETVGNDGSEKPNNNDSSQHLTEENNEQESHHESIMDAQDSAEQSQVHSDEDMQEENENKSEQLEEAEIEQEEIEESHEEQEKSEEEPEESEQEEQNASEDEEQGEAEEKTHDTQIESEEVQNKSGLEINNEEQPKLDSQEEEPLEEEEASEVQDENEEIIKTTSVTENRYIGQEDNDEAQNASEVESENEARNESDVEDQNASEVEAHNESEIEAQNESEIEAQNESEIEAQNESEIAAQNESEDENQNESEMEVQQNSELEENDNNSEDEEEAPQEQDESNIEAAESEQEDQEMQNDSKVDDAGSEDEEQNESEELQYESDEEQNASEDAANDSNVHAQGESEDEIQDTDDHDEVLPSDNGEETPNVSHDTTGRNRQKNSELDSPEAILHDKTNQIESFMAQGRNTSIRKTTMLKNLNIRPSLAPPRESTGMSDGTRNSSAEGSGWDSHRTTRKTLRQTFGRDFTPRKSLRALVMEKSAKRQTAVTDLTSVTTKFPQANSTELPEASMVPDDEDYVEESNHEVSKRTRQTTLEMYLQKIKTQNLEKKMKMEEAVRNSLKAPLRDALNPFKVPSKPMFALKKSSGKPVQSKPKKKTESMFPFSNLPQEVLEDMKYKPPKRFQPSNAAWITKRLYKHLESKLESKYDYKARVRAEKLVETIYHFSKDLRRHDVAPSAAVDALKQEMARLDVVKTHFEFYQFFHEYMPREIRVKVVPDVVNKIGMPRHGVFSDILRGNTVQG